MMALPQWPIHSGVQILSKLKFFTTRGPDIVLLMASAQSRLHRAVWQKQRGNFMSTFSLVFALYFCNAPSFVVFTMILEFQIVHLPFTKVSPLAGYIQLSILRKDRLCSLGFRLPGDQPS